MHSCAARVARFAAGVALPHLILTHFSPRYRDRGKGPLIADIGREAAAHYQGRLYLARDLDRYQLDEGGRLTATPFEPARVSARAAAADGGGGIDP